MELRKTQIRIVLGVLIAFVILSSMALSSPGITSFIVGVPSTCKSNISLDAPQSVDLYAGSTEEILLKIKSIACGVSFVRLELNGIARDFYTVGPSYIPVLAPGKEGNMSIFFDIPEGTEEKTYTGLYTIRTNEGNFILGELNVNILAPAKPKAEIESISISKEEVVVKGIDKAVWYGIGFLAAILAIILISLEYFSITKKRTLFEALKRSEEEIHEALGVEPEKKEEFEKALRKQKKS